MSLSFRTCLECKSTAPLEHVWFAALYEHIIKDALWDFKFHKQRVLRASLAHLAVSVVHLRNSDVVAWVPASPRHQRQRGYDHTKLLAQSVAQSLQLPALSLLSRKGSARQVGLSRQERWQQAKGQYATRQTRHIKDKHVLLVDDVVTSGATLAACANQLKAAGARSVSAVVVAKD